MRRKAAFLLGSLVSALLALELSPPPTYPRMVPVLTPRPEPSYARIHWPIAYSPRGTFL